MCIHSKPKHAGITHFARKCKSVYARYKHRLEHADKQTCRMWHTAAASRPNICCHMYYFSRTPVCHWDACIASWTPTFASLTSAQCLFRGQPVSLHVFNMHTHMCTPTHTQETSVTFLIIHLVPVYELETLEVWYNTSVPFHMLNIFHFHFHP